MKLNSRIAKLEEKNQPAKPYHFYSVWFNSYELPVLFRGVGERLGLFQSEAQYEQFADEAANHPDAVIVVFPIHWKGEAKPVPDNATMVTGWDADFNQIHTRSVQG